MVFIVHSEYLSRQQDNTQFNGCVVNCISLSIGTNEGLQLRTYALFVFVLATPLRARRRPALLCGCSLLQAPADSLAVNELPKPWAGASSGPKNLNFKPPPTT